MNRANTAAARPVPVPEPTPFTPANRKVIRQLNQAEAVLQYRKIVDERMYSQYGFAVRAGDTVFDVGANIGMSALYLYWEAEGVRIFAFEPTAPMFRALADIDEHWPLVRQAMIPVHDRVDRVRTGLTTLGFRTVLSQTSSCTTSTSSTSSRGVEKGRFSMAEQEQRLYSVVLNDEEQYSIWAADSEPPAGWRREGKSGTEQECLDYIDTVWTDMRPLSLRRALESASLPIR